MVLAGGLQVISEGGVRLGLGVIGMHEDRQRPSPHRVFAAWRLRFTPALAVVLSLSLAPSVAFGQAASASEDLVWGDLTFTAASAALGAITGGLGRWLNGGSFSEGFTIGSAGGALAYGGRRVAVADFAGAGIVGRQISAVGASMVANTAGGRAPLERVDLAVGPLILRFGPSETLNPQPRLVLWDAFWLISAIAEPRLQFDWRESLSYGSPVFFAPEHEVGHRAAGKHRGGLILLGQNYRPTTLEHEFVHVLQFDMVHRFWGQPLEGWALRALGVGPEISRWVELGLTGPLLGAAVKEALSLEWEQRPWEVEAEYLSRR